MGIPHHQEGFMRANNQVREYTPQAIEVGGLPAAVPQREKGLLKKLLAAQPADKKGVAGQQAHQQVKKWKAPNRIKRPLNAFLVSRFL